jgi:hypothetical protein
MLVLAFAVPAMAINRSGQDRLGAKNDAQGAGAMTYENWSEANGTNAGTNSPHGNYTTTTVKCVVCHAVHYAAPAAPAGYVAGNDYTVPSGNQAADTLLRSKASDACIYCHATAGIAVNGKPVYDGLNGALVGDGATGGWTTTGHAIGENCSVCHSSVHGAGADDSVASLKGYLLRALPATNVQGTGADTGNMIEAITAIDHNYVNQVGGNDPLYAGKALNGTIAQYATVVSDTLREQAVGVFCAECHLGAYATAAPGAATNVYDSGTAAYSGHRIAATPSSTWNVDGDISSGVNKNLTVAWNPATNCKSCHDATDTFGDVAFPHSWGGTKMWLTVAEDADAPKTDLPYGTAAGSGYDEDSPQLSDGVCLKCHVQSGGAAGVGITF